LVQTASRAEMRLSSSLLICRKGYMSLWAGQTWERQLTLGLLAVRARALPVLRAVFRAGAWYRAVAAA
jgi:hypothetical protein